MVEKSMGAALRFFEKVGHRINNAVQRLGFAARFFVMVLVYSGQSFRRFHLTIREIYFSGFQSLLIILVSGLFIGMVLGMQGYETLQRYGSSEALGVLVALSLTRELGPVARREHGAGHGEHLHARGDHLGRVYGQLRQGSG